MTKSPKKKSHFLRNIFIGVFVLIFVISAGVFTAFILNKQKVIIQQPPAQYIMKENYTKDDLLNAFRAIRKDREFAFYFRVMDKREASIALKDVMDILLEKRNRQELFEVIREKKAQVSRLSKVFFYMDYAANYLTDEKEDSVAYKVMREFLYEEFKLTVLGAFYRGTYDRNFSFEWDRSDVLSALKLKSLLTGGRPF